MTDDLDPSVRFPEMPPVLFAYDFPRWKWSIVRQCFPSRQVVFLRDSDRPPASSWLILWGMAALPDEAAPDACVLRVEDGFLRSVGLGADLVRPVSWTVDRRGIYYDASRPSDLEVILATHEFDAAICARAGELRARIIAERVTKYNVGFRSWRRPSGAARVILVPGQVESDASIRFGAPAERRNLGLLRAVRLANPDAHLVYKPHPDVLARLRREGDGERQTRNWCDEIVTDVSMGDLLSEVDEVHVLTSLAGFEALLRGKPVTCYGQPFYSGWGLTCDIVPSSRRSRRLCLDKLVAGALIQYPLYMSRDGRRLISPEEALDSLLLWRKKTGGRDPSWRGIHRFFLRRIAGVR